MFTSHPQSYHERDAFIATQGPKQNTIGDFWRMIFEKEVSTIVMLTPLVDRGRVSLFISWRVEQRHNLHISTFAFVHDVTMATTFLSIHKMRLNYKCLELQFQAWAASPRSLCETDNSENCNIWPTQVESSRKVESLSRLM